MIDIASVISQKSVVSLIGCKNIITR